MKLFWCAAKIIMSPFYPKSRPISDFFQYCSVIWEKAKCGKSKRGDTLKKSLWARFAPGFDQHPSQHPIIFTKLLCNLKWDLNDVQWTGRMMISRKRDQCYLGFRHFKMMMRTQDVLDCLGNFSYKKLILVNNKQSTLNWERWVAVLSLFRPLCNV